MSFIGKFFLLLIYSATLCIVQRCTCIIYNVYRDKTCATLSDSVYEFLPILLASCYMYQQRSLFSCLHYSCINLYLISVMLNGFTFQVLIKLNIAKLCFNSRRRWLAKLRGLVLCVGLISARSHKVHCSGRLAFSLVFSGQPCAWMFHDKGYMATKSESALDSPDRVTRACAGNGHTRTLCQSLRPEIDWSYFAFSALYALPLIECLALSQSFVCSVMLVVIRGNKLVDFG